jgi:hypothetical protein
MTMAFSRIFRATAGTAAIALLLAVGVAHSTGTRHIEAPDLAQTAAEQAFPDTDYGVDPMVTGPTSASFKKQQAEAGCDKAVWPDIPLACYPNR